MRKTKKPIKIQKNIFVIKFILLPDTIDLNIFKLQLKARF